MARNRIIYASQSVVVNGDFLYRVQTLGSTTTFTSTDLFELGQQDIIDVVDDVPTVAITLDTNDWGTVRTAAALASVSTADFEASAIISNATLKTVSGTTDINYYHGVALSHYGVAGAEFDLWAPVQSESALGTADDTIDQTLYMARCFVTGITSNYTVGGEATENYTAEADNKTWFLNAGKFVSQEEWDFVGVSGTVNLGLLDGTNEVQTLSDTNLAFLHIDPDTGKNSIKFWDDSDSAWEYYAVEDAATATVAGYDSATNILTLPTDVVTEAGDVLHVRYAADAYADGSGSSTRQKANYFTVATDANTGLAHSNVGGLRQGQVEIYLIDPDVITSSDSYELALRLQTVSLNVTLDREALSELGHLKPYDRPLTYPVEITTTVETTAGDMETFAKFAGKETEYDASTLIDLTIDQLLAKDNLILIVQVYDQTDVEAGGTGSSRLALKSELAGKSYWSAGAVATYDDPIVVAAATREYPLKTLVIPGLKATSEGFTHDQGSNATQTYAFRSTNKMFYVKGFIPLSDLLFAPGFQTA